jgi:membrane-bound serine protease (ClpP class)
VMFLVDLKVAGFGLSIGGLVAFALGSLLVFTPFWEAGALGSVAHLNPLLALGTTLGVTAFFFFGLSAAIKAQREPVAVGRETMIGKVGVVRQPLNPVGIVHLQGEEWSAVSADGSELPAGISVRVIANDGLMLRVAPAVDEDNPPPAAEG